MINVEIGGAGDTNNGFSVIKDELWKIVEYVKIRYGCLWLFVIYGRGGVDE